MYKIIRASRLYEQIVQQVEESIHKGALKPGDQLLPSVNLRSNLASADGGARSGGRRCGKGLVEPIRRGTFITDGSSNTMKQSLHRMMRRATRVRVSAECGDPGAGDRGVGDDSADEEVLAAMKEQWK